MESSACFDIMRAKISVSATTPAPLCHVHQSSPRLVFGLCRRYCLYVAWGRLVSIHLPRCTPRYHVHVLSFIRDKRGRCSCPRPPPLSERMLNPSAQGLHARTRTADCLLSGRVYAARGGLVDASRNQRWCKGCRKRALLLRREGVRAPSTVAGGSCLRSRERHRFLYLAR